MLLISIAVLVCRLGTTSFKTMRTKYLIVLYLISFDLLFPQKMQIIDNLVFSSFIKSETLPDGKIKYLLTAYTFDHSKKLFLENLFQKCGIYTVNDLHKILDQPIGEYEVECIANFVHWLRQDKREALYSSLLKMITKDPDDWIIKARIEGQSFQEIGSKAGCSREWAHQKEKRLLFPIRTFMMIQKPIAILLAFNPGDAVLSNQLMRSVFAEYEPLFRLYLKQGKLKQMTYLKEQDCFVVGNIDWIQKLDAAILLLPNSLGKEKLEKEVLNLYHAFELVSGTAFIRDRILLRYIYDKNILIKKKRTLNYSL